MVAFKNLLTGLVIPRLSFLSTEFSKIFGRPRNGGWAQMFAKHQGLVFPVKPG
jgi:hypothetical protein